MPDSQDELKELCERVQQLEADAQRWRWVREHGPECLLWHYESAKWETGRAADKSVDQAIAASQGREVSGGA